MASWWYISLCTVGFFIGILGTWCTCIIVEGGSVLWEAVLCMRAEGKKVIGSKSCQFWNMNRSHVGLGWVCWTWSRTLLYAEICPIPMQTEMGPKFGPCLILMQTESPNFGQMFDSNRVQKWLVSSNVWFQIRTFVLDCWVMPLLPFA